MFVEKNNDISFCNEYGHIYHMSWCDVTSDCYTIRIDRFTSFRFNRFSSFFMTNQSNDILLLKKNDKLSYYQNRSLDTLIFRFQIRVDIQPLSLSRNIGQSIVSRCFFQRDKHRQIEV